VPSIPAADRNDQRAADQWLWRSSSARSGPSASSCTRPQTHRFPSEVGSLGAPLKSHGGALGSRVGSVARVLTASSCEGPAFASRGDWMDSSPLVWLQAVADLARVGFLLVAAAGRHEQHLRRDTFAVLPAVRRPRADENRVSRVQLYCVVGKRQCRMT
jgi:hypothetical protein